MRQVHCPYYWCGDPVSYVRVEEPWITNKAHRVRMIIHEHPIKHPALTGMCPASLMDWPAVPPGHAAELLAEAKARDSKLVEAWANRLRKKSEEPPTKPPRSYSARQPGRMGREPHPESDDWVLGGRADEDIIPQGEEKTGKVPASTSGHSMTGRGTAMASIDETAGMVNLTGVKMAEARLAMEQAKACLDEAKSILGGLMGENAGDTLMAYMAHVSNAQDKMITGMGQVDMALDCGQDYVNRLYS